MRNIEIYNENKEFSSFSNEKLSSFMAVDSTFSHCLFENMKVDNFCFGGGYNKTKYINCSFDNSVFSSKSPGFAYFEGCTFRNVRIKNFFCVEADFVNCIFSGRIEKGNFIGVYRDLDGTSIINKYEGNDFRLMLLDDVGFTNIDFSLQLMPDNPHQFVISDVMNFINTVEYNIGNISDKAIRDAVVKVVNIIRLEVKGSNNQIFIDKRSFPNSLQNALDFIVSYIK